MKKLRLFDSLKFMRFVVAVACIFILNVAHAATLPAGYTELEYLESTGEQYVELSFGFDPTDMILADLSVNIEEYSDKYMVAPKVWNSNANRFAMGVHNYVYSVAYGNVQTVLTPLNPSKRNDGQIHKWIYGGYVFSIPELNTSRDVSDITFGTTTSNIRLFYGYNGGTKGKISYYKHVKANGTSVELIPVRRDSDGVLGMYDLADSNPATAFHTNGGTGNFVAGPAVPIKIATTKYNEQQFAPVETRLDAAVAAVDTVVTQTMSQAQAIDTIATTKQTRPDEGCTAKYCLLVEGEDGTPHWYPIAGANGVEYVLPSGYTKLEYLQSDGSSWIIVPYRVNNKTVFYARYNQMQKGAYAASVVFGVTSTPDVSKANYGIVRLLQGTAVFNRMGWGDSTTGSNIDVNAPQNLNTWYEVLYDQNKLYQDNVLYATSATSNDTEWVANYDLGIFARNGPSANNYPAIAKISSVWAKEDGEYKINLIPARRDSDRALGMYDMVSGTFFTNAGTGTFTAGPEM